MPAGTQPASALLFSALVIVGLTYLLVSWSVRLRLVAQPRADRWHGQATPNTGGLAILTSSAAGYCLFAWVQYPAIALCGVFVSLLGFLDDRVPLRPLAKFAGQSIAVLAVIGASAGLVSYTMPVGVLVIAASWNNATKPACPSSSWMWACESGKG